MKKTILLLSVFFFALSLFAQKPTIKFYLNDGSSKPYNLVDIQTLKIKSLNQNTIMNIFYDKTNNEIFATYLIDSISFTNLNTDTSKMNISYLGEQKSYYIKSIDSIRFAEQSQILKIQNNNLISQNAVIYIEGQKYISSAPIQNGQFSVIVKNDVVYFHYIDATDTTITLSKENSIMALFKLIVNYEDAKINQLIKKIDKQNLLSTPYKFKTGVDMEDKGNSQFLFTNQKARWAAIEIDNKTPFLLRSRDLLPDISIASAIGLVVDSHIEKEPIVQVTNSVKTYGSPIKAYLIPNIAILNLLNSDLNNSIKKAIQENPDLFKKVVSADAISMFTNAARKLVSTITAIPLGSCCDFVSNAFVSPLELSAWSLINVSTTSEYDQAKTLYLKSGIDFLGEQTECIAEVACSGLTEGACHILTATAKLLISYYNDFAASVNLIAGIYDATTTLAYDNYQISTSPLINSINPSSAKVGDIITISGSNFGSTQGSSFVSFAGTNASEYPYWSDTQIKVKVPTGATSGKISVTVNGIKSNEKDITINTTPNISTIYPSKDAYIENCLTDDNFNGKYLKLGNHIRDQYGPCYKKPSVSAIVLKFDISNMNIDVSKIEKATLFLKAFNSVGTVDTAIVDRIKNNWNEDDITYNILLSNGVQNDTIKIINISGDLQIDVTDYVKNWINNPQNNFGLLIHPDYPDLIKNNKYIEFYDKENGVDNDKPHIKITFI